MISPQLVAVVLAQAPTFFCPHGNVAAPDTSTTCYDPVNIGYGDWVTQEQDVEISGIGGPVPFVRSFSTSLRTWNWPLGNAAMEGIPKPFGERPASASMFWWHNWLSLVEKPPGLALFVRQRGGRLTQWTHDCPSGGWNSIENLGAGESLRLGCTSAGFVLVEADGTRVYYEHKITTSSPVPVERWFISRVVSAENVPVATLNYGVPLDALGNTLSCPAPVGGTWVPYIRSIDAASGPSLELRYWQTTIGGSPTCPIAELRQKVGNSSIPIVKYTYSTGFFWGSELKLASVVVQSQGSTSAVTSKTYSYSGFNTSPPYLYFYSPKTGHQITLRSDAVTAVLGPSEDSTAFAMSFSGGVNQINVSRRVGTGVFPTDSQTVSERLVTAIAPGFHGARFDTSTLLSCPSGACPQSAQDWEWIDAGTVTRRISVDSQANHSIESVSPSSAGNGSYPVTIQSGITQSTATLPNIETPGNCAGVECRWMENSVVANGAVRVTKEWTPSGFTTGSLVETRRAYDTNGALISVIVKGDTTNPASTGYVGTFYRRTRSSGSNCTAGSDPYGRLVEIQGPCFVADFNASVCSGTFPMTQMIYHSGSAPSNGTDRLARVSRFPNGCASLPVSTQYTTFDKSGLPTTTLMPDGTSILNTYDDLGRLLSTQIGSRVWQYGYTSAGKLAFTRQPGGDFLVNCYQPMPLLGDGGIPPLPSTCNRLSETDELGWTAVAADGDGTGWVSARGYTYGPTGKPVVVRDYEAPNSAPRFERAVAYDSADNPARIWTGPGGHQADSARFDGDGLRVALGRAFNSPPAFCLLSGGAPSDKCDYFEYDVAHRLKRMTQTPVVGQLISTFLEYDAAGNVCEYGVGSSTAGCSMNDSNSIGYRTDDFGNVVSISLPNTVNVAGTSKGVYDLRYDAAGNLVNLVTPDVRSQGGGFNYTYDSLSRLTQVVQYATIPTLDYISIYEFSYGAGYSGLPTSCPVPQRVEGRLSAVSTPAGTLYLSYDELGNVVRSNLVRAGSAPACGSLGQNIDTQYFYNENGDLWYMIYPSGRHTRWYFGTGANAGRVTEVWASVRETPTNESWRQIARNFVWEPNGRVRSYESVMDTSQNVAFVSYASADAVVTGCGNSLPQTATSDERIGFVWVGTSAGGGQIFKQGYGYTTPSGQRADQVTSISTCYLGGAQQTTQYGFDESLRLTSVSGSSTRGPVSSWSTGYDARGNRVSYQLEGQAQAFALSSNALLPDQLLSRKGPGASTALGVTYSYDRNGRTTQRTWANDSSGASGDAQSYGYKNGYAAMGDSAIRKVTVKGQVYEYAYDHQQRRMTKFYPTGGRDEYVYSEKSPHQMLVDLGRTRADGRAISDDYIWVAGLPIAVARGSFTSGWVREVDSLTDCSKGGELSSIPCGYRHLVNDYQGKPVLSLDSSRRISGVAEYGPFGEVNTRYLGSESAHPYPNNLQQTLSSWTQDSAGLNQLQRLNFDAFDIEPAADSVVMKDGAGSTLLTLGGYHVGRFTTPWVNNPGGGYSVTFTSDALNCAPGDPFCTQGPWAYTGVALRSIEYARVQSGATPWFPPLRFSGQYRDQETGLHENWNRFYEAESGRYLSPEPMLQDPKWVRRESERGLSAPTYAYARNNSIRYTDPTGLCVSTYDCCMQRNPGNPAACGGFAGPKPFELPKFDPKSMLKPFKKFAEDVCKIVAMSSTVKTCTLIGIGLGTGYCLYNCDGERRTGPFSVGGGGNSCEPTLDYDKTSSDVPDLEWTMFPP